MEDLRIQKTIRVAVARLVAFLGAVTMPHKEIEEQGPPQWRMGFQTDHLAV